MRSGLRAAASAWLFAASLPAGLAQLATCSRHCVPALQKCAQIMSRSMRRRTMRVVYIPGRAAWRLRDGEVHVARCINRHVVRLTRELDESHCTLQSGVRRAAQGQLYSARDRRCCTPTRTELSQAEPSRSCQRQKGTRSGDQRRCEPSAARRGAAALGERR